jgi:hypothetical protein
MLQKSPLALVAWLIVTGPPVVFSGLLVYVQAASAPPLTARLAPRPKVKADAPTRSVERMTEFFAIGSISLNPQPTDHKGPRTTRAECTRPPQIVLNSHQVDLSLSKHSEARNWCNAGFLRMFCVGKRRDRPSGSTTRGDVCAWRSSRGEQIRASNDELSRWRAGIRAGRRAPRSRLAGFCTDHRRHRRSEQTRLPPNAGNSL